MTMKKFLLSVFVGLNAISMFVMLAGYSQQPAPSFSSTPSSEAPSPTKAAETIAEATDTELYELTPMEPYTDADLNWVNSLAVSQ